MPIPRPVIGGAGLVLTLNVFADGVWFEENPRVLLPSKFTASAWPK